MDPQAFRTWCKVPPVTAPVYIMLPDSRSDQSYGRYPGLIRMSSNGVSPPSNSQQDIMTRYRPIAPKPSTCKPGESAGSAPSDPPSSSTLSFERTSGANKAVSSERSRGGAKKSRRRNGAEQSLPPTKRAKRGQTQPKSRGSAPVAGIQKAVEQFAPDQSRFYPMPPNACFPQGGATSSPYGAELAPQDHASVGEASEGQGITWGRPGPDRRKYSNGFGAFKMPTTSSEWLSPKGSGVAHPSAAYANEVTVATEPSSFMGRAAVSSDAQPFFGRDVNGVEKLKGGCEWDFGNSPGGGSSECYNRETPRSWDFMRRNAPSHGAERNDYTNELASCASDRQDSEDLSSGHTRKLTCGPDPVTLSLFPATPSQSSSSPVSSLPTESASEDLPCLELTMTTNPRNKNETNSGKLTTHPNSRDWNETKSEATTTTNTRNMTETKSEEKERAQVDIAAAEAMYNDCLDPLMIAHEETGELMWANPAYWKAEAGRRQRLEKKEEAGAPYLDTIGIPTKLHRVHFLELEEKVVITRTKAQVWGFLKSLNLGI